MKWFWEKSYIPDQKAKILEGVAKNADSETLKWFWGKSYMPDQKDILLKAKTKKLTFNNTKIHKVKATLGEKFQYDIFISHASEDKDSFVRPLASKLKSRGLRVWYDEFTLSLGDSLRRSIDLGLASSRYGLVVLSKNFFIKEWPQKELDGLVAREDGKEKVILPIWHSITKKEIQRFSPILSDRLAVSSDKGIEFVTNEIIRAINK